MDPPRPAILISTAADPQMPVSNLLIPGLPDTLSWVHSEDGEHTAKSGYKLLQRSTATNLDCQYHTCFKRLWRCKIPPKVVFFWWRMLHDSLPTADNLKKRKLRMDETCHLYGEHNESVNHLFFQCTVSTEVWELASSTKVTRDQLRYAGEKHKSWKQPKLALKPFSRLPPQLLQYHSFLILRMLLVQMPTTIAWWMYLGQIIVVKPEWDGSCSRQLGYV